MKSKQRLLDTVYSIGYISGSRRAGVSKGYKLRAVLAPEVGAQLYQIECTSQCLKRLEKKDEVLVRHWDGGSLKELVIKRPLACYNKSAPKPKTIRGKILSLLAERGTKFVTDLKFRDDLSDKWFQYKLMEKASVPTPKTELLSLETLKLFLQRFKVVFIKPRVASQGKGQLVIKREGEGYALVTSGGKKKYFFSKIDKLFSMVKKECVHLDAYIVQQGINVSKIEGRVYDFRVVCQRSQQGRVHITACYMRIGPLYSHQANIGQHGHPQDPALVFKNWKELSNDIRKISHSVFQTCGFGLGEAGVDLVLTQKGELVCIEINTRPGSKGFQMMREWVTRDPYFQKKTVLPYNYSNRRRALWDRRFSHFKTRPLLYCMYLIDQGV